jgi:hypothetical protein
MYDPVVTKLQRVALLAMQGRQQEAAGHLDRVIQDASPSAQKTIVNAVNNIKPVTINGKPADSSTLDKSSAHQEWILKTFIPWVQSQLNKKDVAEGNEVSDAAQARELIGRAVRNSQERNNYFDFIKHLIKKNGKDYGVRVHQLAAKLAKDSNGVEESRGHKIIATKLRNMDNMKNVQVPTPQEQKAVKDAKEKQTSETKQRLDPKCWKGYKKQGTKMKGNTRVNNCVPVGESAEATMSKLIKLLESK